MQAQNTFTDGMVLDTNPMMVPNTAMTDALNATLVTMNGNEMVLQNDMGNARVNRAALPAGYVPVGMKEYGGIIYIACYNPITGKGQIGSFPSPQRNVDVTEKIGINKNLSVPIIDNGKLLSPITKIELFDDKIVRSGDKFSINIEQLPLTTHYISNCEYIYNNDNNKQDPKNKKVISPQNRMYSFGVATMDSNGQLNDITEKMKRYDINIDTGKTGKTPIKFDITDSDLYKFNKGYFLSNADNTNATSPVAAVRNKVPINTYNSKLFGKLYLWARYNVISSIEVGIIGMLTDSKTSKIRLTNGQEYIVPDKTNSRAILYYIVNYKYNCPDGARENEKLFPPLEGYAHYYSGESSIIDGVTINGNLKSFSTPCDSNDKTTWALGYNYPIYDKVTNLYSFSQIYAQEIPNSFTDDIWNYELVPKMHNESQSFTIPALAVKGSIDLTKLNSGLIKLNAWRYIVDNDNVRISWGFEAYPIYGTSMSNVQFVFRDLQDPNNKIETYIPAAKASYNGEFVDIFSTRYFHTNLQSKTGCLIEVDIQYNVTGESDARHEYRWLIPTGLYNASYFGTGTNENDDFYSYIKDYNNFLNCAYYFNKSYWEFNGSKWISVGSSTNKDIIPSDYFTIEVQSKNNSTFTIPEIKQKYIDDYIFDEKKTNVTVNATYTTHVEDNILLTFELDEKYPLYHTFGGITYSILPIDDQNHVTSKMCSNVSYFLEDENIKIQEPTCVTTTTNNHILISDVIAYARLIGDGESKQFKVLTSLKDQWNDTKGDSLIPRKESIVDYGLTTLIATDENKKRESWIFFLKGAKDDGTIQGSCRITYSHNSSGNSNQHYEQWYNNKQPHYDRGNAENPTASETDIIDFFDTFNSNVILLYGIANKGKGLPKDILWNDNTNYSTILMGQPFCPGGSEGVFFSGRYLYYNYFGMLIKNTSGQYSLLYPFVSQEHAMQHYCKGDSTKQEAWNTNNNNVSIQGTQISFEQFMNAVFSTVYYSYNNSKVLYPIISSSNYSNKYDIKIEYSLNLKTNISTLEEHQQSILNSIQTQNNKKLVTFLYYTINTMKVEHELGFIPSISDQINDNINKVNTCCFINNKLITKDTNGNAFIDNTVYEYKGEFYRSNIYKISNNKLMVVDNNMKVPNRPSKRFMGHQDSDVTFTFGGIPLRVCDYYSTNIDSTSNRILNTWC